jgi:hypothetical protein
MAWLRSTEPDGCKGMEEEHNAGIALALLLQRNFVVFALVEWPRGYSAACMYVGTTGSTGLPRVRSQRSGEVAVDAPHSTSACCMGMIRASGLSSID